MWRTSSWNSPASTNSCPAVISRFIPNHNLRTWCTGRRGQVGGREMTVDEWVGLKARGDCWVTREEPDVPEGASWRDRLLSGKLGRRLEPVPTLDHFPSLRRVSPVSSGETLRTHAGGGDPWSLSDLSRRKFRHTVPGSYRISSQQFESARVWQRNDF